MNFRYDSRMIVAPQTLAGQMVASMMMTIGYSMLAVPTGIAAAELHISGGHGGRNSGGGGSRRGRARGTCELRPVATVACPSCDAVGHDGDAAFCKFCGTELGAGES